MRLPKLLYLYMSLCFWLSCHHNDETHEVEAPDINQDFSQAQVRQYNLTRMDEVVLRPSSVSQIRILISQPFGGETTIVRAKDIGDYYQVVKKVADGGPTAVSYEAMAVGYPREKYQGIWEQVIHDVLQLQIDTIDQFTIFDFATVTIEVVDINEVRELEFLFCGENADAVIKMVDNLLVERSHDLSSFVCPSAQ